MTTQHDLIEVIEFCRERGWFHAEVIGRWVWIVFESKPIADIRQELKDFGFRWIKARGRWAHNCGHPSRRGIVAPWHKYATTQISQVRVDDLQIA